MNRGGHIEALSLSARGFCYALMEGKGVMYGRDDYVIGERHGT